MKTLTIPESFRHSAVEYFDRMVQYKRVKRFFVGAITLDYHFPLAYELFDGKDDIPVAHLNPLFVPEHQIKISVLDDIDPIENLKDALAQISMGNRVGEQQDGIDAIMEYCDIELSMIDFEDDGRFQVGAELEWR